LTSAEKRSSSTKRNATQLQQLSISTPSSLRRRLLMSSDAIPRSKVHHKETTFSLTFEPVCLDSFNDARECLFKMDGLLRVCEPELNLFEECVHDPVRFEKF
jgi:hypothetical protein